MNEPKLSMEGDDERDNDLGKIPRKFHAQLRLGRERLVAGSGSAKPGVLDTLENSSLTVNGTRMTGLTDASLPFWKQAFDERAEKEKSRKHVLSRLDTIRTQCKKTMDNIKADSDLRDADRLLEKFANCKPKDIKNNTFNMIKKFILENPEYLPELQEALGPLGAESVAAVNSVKGLVKQTLSQNESLVEENKTLMENQRFLVDEVDNSRRCIDVLRAKLQKCGTDKQVIERQDDLISTLAGKYRRSEQRQHDESFVFQMEVDELQTMLKSDNKRIADLRNVCRSLEEKISEMTDENNALMKSLVVARENSTNSDEMFERRHTELLTLETAIDETCVELGIALGPDRAMQVLQAARQVPDLKEQYEYWRESADHHNKLNLAAIEHVRAWRESHERRIRELNQLRNALGESNLEITRLRECLNEFDALTHDADALRVRSEANKNTIGFLRQYIRACKQDALANAAKLVESERTLGHNKTLLESNEQERNCLFEEAREAHLDRQGLDSLNVALQQHVAALENEIDQHKREEVDLVGQIQNLELANSNLDIINAGHAKDLEKCQKDIEQHTVDKSLLDSQLTHLRAVNKILDSDNRRLENALRAAETDNQDLQLHESDVLDQLSWVDQTSLIADMEIVRLRAMHTNCDADIALLDTHLRTSQAAIAQSIERERQQQIKVDEFEGRIESLKDERSKDMDLITRSEKQINLLEAVIEEKAPQMSQRLPSYQLLFAQYGDIVTDNGTCTLQFQHRNYLAITGLVHGTVTDHSVYTLGLRVLDMAWAQRPQVSGYLIKTLGHSLHQYRGNSAVFGICVVYYVMELFEKRMLDGSYDVDWETRIVILHCAEILISCTAASCISTKALSMILRLRQARDEVDLLSLTFMRVIEEGDRYLDTSLMSALFSSRLTIAIDGYRILGDGPNMIVGNENDELGFVRPHQFRIEKKWNGCFRLCFKDAAIVGSKGFEMDQLLFIEKLPYYARSYKDQALTGSESDTNLGLVVDV